MNPGDFYWAWVPFADNPAQGKVRPIVVLKTLDENTFIAIYSTSKHEKYLPELKVLEIEFGPAHYSSLWNRKRITEKSFFYSCNIVLLKKESLRDPLGTLKNDDLMS